MSQTIYRTVDEAEVAHFDADASAWWDPQGEYRWLHRYNPVRLAYIRDQACRRFHRDPTRPDYLHGLRILDIGCGGGILCETLARLGAMVVGADPAKIAIQGARLHAEQSGLKIDYRWATVETLAQAEERFDVVISLDVAEHVADWEFFLQKCAELVKPGGLIFLSTVNRNVKSFAYVIVVAEYVLRLLPRGSHQWARFITPDEMRGALKRCGLTFTDLSGVTWNLFAGALQLSTNTDVNYILTAERPS